MKVTYIYKILNIALKHFSSSMHNMGGERVSFIIVFLILMFSSASQSQANPRNEIWLHDAKICVVSDPKWAILSHYSLKSKSILTFQLIENYKPDEVSLRSKLAIKTCEIRNDGGVNEISEMILSRSMEEGNVVFFQGWVIVSLPRDKGGFPHKRLEAYAMSRSNGIAIRCFLSWPLLADRPKDYDQRMSALLKSVISQIRTESSTFTADPPPRGLNCKGVSKGVSPLVKGSVL